VPREFELVEVELLPVFELLLPPLGVERLFDAVLLTSVPTLDPELPRALLDPEGALEPEPSVVVDVPLDANRVDDRDWEPEVPPEPEPWLGPALLAPEEEAPLPPSPQPAKGAVIAAVTAKRVRSRVTKFIFALVAVDV
jgi:hypothetical protein